MARLPTVGGDAGNWGDVLNDYLSQSHNGDGSLKTDSVGAPQLKPNSVTTAAIGDGQVTNSKVADAAIGSNQLSEGSVTRSKLADAGEVNGVATLDEHATLSEIQVPARLTDAQLGRAFVARHATASRAGVRARNKSGLRMLCLGDSIAYFKAHYMFAPLGRAYGAMPYASPSRGAAIENSGNGNGYSRPGITFGSGTAVAVNNAFDAWFSGRVRSMTGGQYQEFGQSGVNATWDVAKVYYAVGPTSADNGSFKIAVDGIDEPGFENMSTAAGTQNIGIAVITKGSIAQRALRVTNLSGSNRIIGVAFEVTTGLGVYFAGIAQGGISLDQALTAGALASLETFLDDFDPDLVTLEMKESSATWGSNLAILLPLLRAHAPYAQIVGIGSTPMASNDTDQVLQNAQLRAACAAYSCTYWDGYSPVVNYETLSALGWAGDGTHVADGASAFLAGLLLDDLGLLKHPELMSYRNINAALVQADKAGIGTNAPTQLLDVVSEGTARMAVRTSKATGQVAIIDLISGFSGVFGDARLQAELAALRIIGPTVGGAANTRVTLEAGGAERLRVTGDSRVIIGGASGGQLLTGTGTPEGYRTAPVGSVYLRTDGAASTTLYVKESGTGTTGWIAK